MEQKTVSIFSFVSKIRYVITIYSQIINYFLLFSKLKYGIKLKKVYFIIIIKKK